MLRFIGDRTTLPLRLAIALLATLAGGLLGCSKKPSEDAAEAPPKAAVKLTVAVADDPPLAAALRRWQAEWAGLSGGTLAVEEGSVEEFLAGPG